MKKIYGFAFASAALMLASCSSDEPAVNNQITENGGYISINIAPADGTTRAGVSDTFKDGEENENTVGSAMVLLFTEDGTTQTQLPQYYTFRDTDWEDGTNGIEKEATLAVEKGSVMPKRILVICNPTSTAPASYKDLTADDVISTAVANPGTYAKGEFVMTNSQWAGGDVLTAIPQNAIQPSMQAAKDNAVTVYVERVVARVDLKNATDLEMPTTEIEGQNLTLKVTGIQASYIANNSNLVKNVGNPSDTYKNLFNDPTHFRYDWAVTNLTWNATGTDHVYGDFTMMPWTSYNAQSTFYLHENTGDKPTMLLLAGNFVDGSDKPVTFAKVAGTFYTENNALDQLGLMLQGLGYQIEGNVALSNADLEWVSLENRDDAAITKESEVKRYKTYAQLKSDFNKTLIGTDVSKDKINELLKGDAYLVQLWKNGACYYYIPIEHHSTGTGTDKVPYNGVVRNIIYDYTINTIKGLGTPVPYPGEDIIPQDPDDDKYYVGATVKTLKWKVVSKNADFGK